MQCNIYFRKDNWEKFKDEENKSDLVNKLLEQHYRPGFIATRADQVQTAYNNAMQPTKPAKIEHKTFFKNKKLNK